MPDMPTFNVDEETADRLLAAFDGQVDESGEQLSPVEAYRRWLKEELINRVTNHEARQGRGSLEILLDG